MAFLLFTFNFGCTKLDTTTLGTDVLTVDNVNTFSQTFDINTTQGIFANDSTLVRKNENYALGLVSADPLFGKTEAAIYVQFKPTFYPFYFGNSGDTVRFTGNPQPFSNRAGFDSAYICLSYKGAWGDTSSSTPLKFQISKITDLNFKAKTDTVRKLNSVVATDGIVLGEVTVTSQSIKDKSVFARGKDSVINTIKIPFNTFAGAAFAKLLYNQDTTGLNNAFKNDSLFRDKFYGFEIKVNSAIGKTLYYVNLTEANSRLEFSFLRKNATIADTIVQSFRMYPVSPNTVVAASSSHNYLVRDRTSSAVTFPSTDNIYIQTAPGTFGNLSIPNLTGLSNRIIHRAYLVVEQTGITATQSVYTPPPYLYLDLKDTIITPVQRFKPIYFDLNSTSNYNPDANIVNPLYHPYPNENVDIRTFGGQALARYDVAGNLFYRYEINITRYVQHIVTNGYKNYDLRLYAPFNYYYPQYLGTQYLIPFFNPIAAGSIKVGSGNTSDVNHRMRLVVIYSKL